MGQDIIIPPDGEMIIPEDAKVVTVDRKEKAVNIPAVLNYIASSANFASVVGSIRKGMQYVVEVPAQFQAALNSGELSMLRGESSGKMWATIVRKLENGKNEIVANCPIAEQAVYQGNPIQDMSTSLYNFQMQQQMDALRQLAEETLEIAKRIEQGQQDDREGLLLSGKNDIILALEETDAQSRKRQIELARSKVSTAQGQIGKTLTSLVRNYSPIPKSKLGQGFRVFFNSSYLQGKDAEYYKIQDYYQLYLQATEMLAASYAVCGDMKRAQHVFEMAINYLRELDFGNVSTFSYMHPKEDAKEMFFNNAPEYIQAAQAACIESAKPFEFIAIQLSGDELLEVIGNGEEI